jgi:1-acyl-sn-glycerol-3-phosphate acyltransferase
VLISFDFGPQPERFVQVKDALFANPLAGAIMRAAGNIPVDRKNKNNQSLFAGSFEGE